MSEIENLQVESLKKFEFLKSESCFTFEEAAKGSRKKNPGYFTVRLTVRGGGHPPRPDCSICENFRT